MSQPLITRTIAINAPVPRVWAALTNPKLMKKWMSDTEIEIMTDWQVGNPILIRGNWYKTRIENKGVVLRVEPEQFLSYSHLSSLSRLPDQPESYSILMFMLTPEGAQTILTLQLSNFPTETIQKHLEFYWTTTLEIIKKLVEGERD